LFYAGLIFAFYLLFPVAFGFLTSVGPKIVNFTPDIQYYLDFVLKVSFAFGVAFEVPVATILLIIFGATTAEKLKKNRPYVIIGAFVLGMLLTPPDVISQILIAIPMWLLFEAGLFFSPMFKKIKKVKTEETNSQDSENENQDDLDDEFDQIEAEMDEFERKN